MRRDEGEWARMLGWNVVVLLMGLVGLDVEAY